MKNLNAVLAFTALGQESRLNIFRLIVQRADRGVTPSELIELLGIPAATLSFHLKELAHAGLISFERQGRSLVYRPQTDFVNQLIDFLSENCCGGKPCGLMPLVSNNKTRPKKVT
jgi:ArsR family transcriptional regulator, arsenate/arsenite/antimonite-responsive transcriptional repressor